jgi:hypothetical protein
VRRWLGPALLLGLVAAAAEARPGGGSSFSSSSSSRSSGSSSSGSSSRSSWSSGSSSRSSWGSSSPSRSQPVSYRPSAPAQPQLTLEDVSYMAHRPQARRSLSASWQLGRLGPYGAGPARPASFTITQPHRPTESWVESFDGALKLGGVLLTVVLLVGASELRDFFRASMGWTTAEPPEVETPPPPPAGVVRKHLEAIRRLDPDFSVVLLEDFLYALYTEAQMARGQRATARLAPYLGPRARVQLDALGAHPVSGVVVGSLRFLSSHAGPTIVLAVEFEANYAQEQSGQTHGYYTRELWRLERKAEVRSRPPEKIRVLGCPACGAPLDRLLGSTCQYCNRVVDGGNFDWLVTAIVVHERSLRGPMLTGTVAEAGTDLPTRFDPGLAPALALLRSRDPAFDEATFRARVEHIFQTMQTAWSTLAWEQARPYLSDNLFEAQSYWIAAYRAQGLRNVTADTRVTNIELVRLSQDRWFDALTVRLHAVGRDYTVRDADGEVVGGSASAERSYTEYWTLIRGSRRAGPPPSAGACPSCSASLELSMAARCTHCQAKVNSGEFDWVLSRIEQDEVYSG